MSLEIVDPHGQISPIQSKQDFEKTFNIHYLPHLIFDAEKTYSNVKKKVKSALKKQWITPHQKWLGEYFSYGIRNKIKLDLSIRWIDAKMGYGLWTNQEIPAHFCIGEYTGILRRRKFFRRWKNHYCFVYNIGEARRTGYTIDAEAQGNYTRFINHSEEGNLEAASVYCDDFMHIILYTLQKIPANTQLCYDYGPDYWTKRKKPLKIYSY